MKICLDKGVFHTKPSKLHIPEINERIINCAVDISINSFAEQITQPYGRTWTPAYFGSNNGMVKRTNICWAGQMIFALDFDGGITVEEVIKRCTQYQVMPAFIYTTFSSVNNNKFRVVFQMNFEIREMRVRNVIQYALLVLFKEADKNCKDASRMFYGGKELIYTDYDTTLDIEQLVMGMCQYLQENDSSHASRQIRKYCERVGLDRINGMPRITNGKSIIEEMAKSGHNLYIYYRTRPKIARNDDIVTVAAAIPTHGTQEEVVLFFNDNVTESIVRDEGQPPKFNSVNDVTERIKIRDIDLNELMSDCKLYRDFITGQYWAYHDEIFGIATNLLAVKGGREKFLQGINSRVEYDKNKWNFYANYINKMDYHPQACDNFCQFCNECEHAKNMIEQVKIFRGRVNIINALPIITLAEAESRVAKEFERVVASKENKVYVIKAPPGIGKTELYLLLKNTTVALPRHNLKAEVSERMKAKGNQHEVIPELPKENEGFLSKLTSLYTKGHYEGATALKKEMAKHDKSMEEYLKKLELIKNCDCTLLTTHERLLYTEDNNNQIVIDEDIVATLLKINKVSISDLIAISNRTKLFPSITGTINNAEIGVVISVSMDMRFELALVPEQHKAFLKQIEEFSTNVVDFLGCSHWIKNNDDSISYITRRYLPQKKTIIMSATADEYIYKMLFGDRLEFIDIGEVEKKGNVVQYPQWSFSRYRMKTDDQLIQRATVIAGDKPVITFKRYAIYFPSCVATFGNLTGIDALSGKDIVIIGTPHINPTSYLLYAHALEVNPLPSDTSMSHIQIRRNGMEFYFFTFADEILREIQLYLIESELLQAVGRARLLRQHCTVTVMSSMPLVV